MLDTRILFCNCFLAANSGSRCSAHCLGTETFTVKESQALFIWDFWDVKLFPLLEDYGTWNRDPRLSYLKQQSRERSCGDGFVVIPLLQPLFSSPSSLFWGRCIKLRCCCFFLISFASRCRLSFMWILRMIKHQLFFTYVSLQISIIVIFPGLHFDLTCWH